MSCNIWEYALDQTLTNLFVSKYGLLCALDCNKYKPITIEARNTTHSYSGIPIFKHTLKQWRKKNKKMLCNVPPNETKF